MPICAPSGPTRRTSRARILSLIRGSALDGGVAIGGSSCRACFLLWENKQWADVVKPTPARGPIGLG